MPGGRGSALGAVGVNLKLLGVRHAESPLTLKRLSGVPSSTGSIVDCVMFVFFK